MSIYRIQAHRHTHPRLGGEDLSDVAIGWLIPDAVVIERTRPDSLRVNLKLHLKRDDYLAGMNEILAMMQRLGYSVVDATVSEWVDRSVESMVLGALGAGGSAQAVAKIPVVSLAAAIAGALAARWVESELRRLEVVYRLVPSSTGWVLTPVSETERQQELAEAPA